VLTVLTLQGVNSVNRVLTGVQGVNRLLTRC